MKTLIVLSLFIGQQVATVDCISDSFKAIRAIEQTLKRNSNKKAVPAAKLAPAILRLSQEYDVDAMTIARIIMVESKGMEKAYNKRTQDYGLMQLNVHSMAHYGISKVCAMHWECNLEAGIMLLSEISDGRTCRYNVGSGKLIKGKLRRCIAYENKIASIN
jgi:hypothetical protein